MHVPALEPILAPSRFTSYLPTYHASKPASQLLPLFFCLLFFASVLLPDRAESGETLRHAKMRRSQLPGTSSVETTDKSQRAGEREIVEETVGMDG